MQQVSLLRQDCIADPSLAQAVSAVKRLQSQRFAGTYSDLLQGGQFQAAAQFFLEELYSDGDYAERDAQFARIAGAVQKLFPAQVAATAVSLAELHQVTEQLDHAMGLAWRETPAQATDAARYVQAWRAVGQRQEREAQLRVVLGIGREMTRFTRTPGLRMMLRMMRGPAAAAGLSSLQHFLETGFDTFAGMSRVRNGAETFLSVVEERESALISQLFDAPAVACETQLQDTLGLAR